MKKSKRGVGSIVAALVAIVITLLAVGLVYAVWIMPSQANHSAPPPPNAIVTTTNAQGQVLTTTANGNSGSGYYGPVSTTVTGYDHFNPSTTYASSTNFNVIWFDNPTGQQYIQLGQNAQTIQVDKGANGVVYAEVQVVSGQNYYVDAALTQSRNSGVQSWSYFSIPNNGINYFVFKISLANMAVQSGIVPSFSFYPYFIAYQALSISSPSAVTSIGTAQKTEFLQFTGTLPTANPNSGAEITEMQVMVNTTQLAVFQLNNMNDPASGILIQGTQFTPQAGTNETYSFDIANSVTDFSTGQYLLYGTNSLDSYLFTVSATVDFGAATGTLNGQQVIISVYVLQPSGALSVVKGLVNLSK